MRTIGTVETLLILSEWPPRSLLGAEDLLGPDKEHFSACKHQDDVAWTNVALVKSAQDVADAQAVRIAQEVELNDEKTYAPGTSSSWKARRRINAWIREAHETLS